MGYIRDNMNLTPAAKTYFHDTLPLPTPAAYYKTIDGVHYDAGLLLEIEEYGGDGKIDLDEAKRIWASAQDGHGVTQCEKATIKYAMATHKAKLTKEASDFLEEKLKKVK